MQIIDGFLNDITMYRLVLYYLLFLLAGAVLLSFFGVLPYSVWSIVFSVGFLVVISWLVNTIFGKVFQAPVNPESSLITALILALIITPAATLHDLAFLFWAAVLSEASKYILAVGRKHLFNPAALAAALTALVLGQSASWWVGTASMLPFVLLGGWLIVRKIRREDLVFSFLIIAAFTTLVFGFLKGGNLLSTGQKIILDSPLLFLAFVMLTEPLTTPPGRDYRMVYGGLVGFLFAPQVHLGSFYSTPELALLAGNVFSYLVSPKQKLILRLKEKIQIAPDIYDFLFQSDSKLAFTPGQYLEWTLSHNKADSRGSRRYFTIASSPAEEQIRIGVKFAQNASSFKKALLLMEKGSQVIASQTDGDFILPNDPTKKLVFIAGGIGITPFRSILKYLLDTNQKRDIVLFYTNREAAEVVYTDVLERARQLLGIRVVYTLTESAPKGWQGRVGRLDEQILREEILDFRERIFYLSGPRGMVSLFEEILAKMGVKKGQIKTDYFPGFA